MALQLADALLELAHLAAQLIDLAGSGRGCGGGSRRRCRPEHGDTARVEDHHLDVVAEAVDLAGGDDRLAVVVRPAHQPAAHQQYAHVTLLGIEIEPDRRPVVLRRGHRSAHAADPADALRRVAPVDDLVLRQGGDGRAAREQERGAHHREHAPT